MAKAASTWLRPTTIFGAGSAEGEAVIPAWRLVRPEGPGLPSRAAGGTRRRPRRCTAFRATPSPGPSARPTPRRVPLVRDGHARRQPGPEQRPPVVEARSRSAPRRASDDVGGNSPGSATTLRGIQGKLCPGRLVEPDDPAPERLLEGVDVDADRVARQRRRAGGSPLGWPRRRAAPVCTCSGSRRRPRRSRRGGGSA